VASVPGSVVGGLKVNTDGLISATTSLLTVLIVFDSWQTLGFWRWLP